MPHAPVLVPGMSRRADEAKTPPKIDATGADVVVLASPHGRATGIYRTAAGSLDRFGVPGYESRAEHDEEMAGALAGAWGRPLLDGPVDHGAVVPLWWLLGTARVIACTFAETTGPRPPGDHGVVADEGARLAAAIRTVEPGASVAFVASAHLSAGLSPSAPLAQVPGSREFDERIRRALLADPALVRHVSPKEWRVAGACGSGPLTAFARLFGGLRPRALDYSCPFGVGYVSAEVRP